MSTIELPLLTLIGTTGEASYDDPAALSTVGGGQARMTWRRWGPVGDLRTDNGTNVPFGLAELPTGATVTSVEYVAVAYRTGGGDHPAPDLGDPFSSLTYPTLNVRFIGDGTGFAGLRVEPLPIGDFDGEVAVPLSSGLWQYVIAGHPSAPPGFEGIAPLLTTGPGDYDFGVTTEFDVVVDYLAIRVTYNASRLRVNVGKPGVDAWKYFIPQEGENDGFGVGKIFTSGGWVRVPPE